MHIPPLEADRSKRSGRFSLSVTMAARLAVLGEGEGGGKSNGGGGNSKSGGPCIVVAIGSG